MWDLKSLTGKIKMMKFSDFDLLHKEIGTHEKCDLLSEKSTHPTFYENRDKIGYWYRRRSNYASLKK